MDQYFDLFLMIIRWLHTFAGVVWIGHLYYFNFVQGAFFNETDATTKSNAIQKLVPRALWWFRWGALWTMVLGIIYLAGRGHQAHSFAIFNSTSWGVIILTGASMGIIMGLNVWGIIWRAQKVVIQSAVQVAAGGKPIAEAAALGARAMVASRTNTLFSIPMLFLMGAASHWPITISPNSNVGLYFTIAFLIMIAIEINAIKGKTGPLTTVKGVITCGFALTAVFIALLAVLI